MTDPRPSPHPPSQNQDELLAQHLDQTLPDDLGLLPQTSSNPLVEVAARLARAPQPTLRVEAANRIRQQVLAAHQAQRQPQGSPWRMPRYGFAAVALVILMLFVGLTPPTLASLPGGALYPLKQLIEQGEWAAAASPEARAFTHLLHAERRVQEAEGLAAHGEIAPESLRAALAEIQAAQAASDLPTAALDALAGRIAALRERLARIVNPPPGAGPDVQQTLIPWQTAVQALPGEATATASPAATAAPAPTLSLTPTMTPTWTPTSAPTAAPTAPPPTDPPAGGAAQPPPDQATPWNEDADCSQPPPPWAPALGWRARCEGAPPPGNGGGNGGPPPGAGNGGPPPGAGNGGPPPGEGRPPR